MRIGPSAKVRPGREAEPKSATRVSRRPPTETRSAIPARKRACDAMTKFEMRILSVAAAISRGKPEDAFTQAELLPALTPGVPDTPIDAALARLAARGLLVPLEPATWRMTASGWETTGRLPS